MHKRHMHKEGGYHGCVHARSVGCKVLPASFDLRGEQGVDPGLVDVAVAQVVGVLLSHPNVLLDGNGHARVPLSFPQAAAVAALCVWHTGKHLDLIKALHSHLKLMPYTTLQTT